MIAVLMSVCLALAASTLSYARNTATVKGTLPQFLDPIGNATVVVGRNATMSCSVENLGKYKVAWAHLEKKMVLTIHRNVVTRMNRYEVRHEAPGTWHLHISKVKEEDRGHYMCQLNTKPIMSQVGFLQVVVPPRIDDKNSSSSTLTVGEFADVVLTCRANGYPKPIIVWRREDGRQIALNRTKRVNSTEGEKLKLREVSRHDIGGYLCFASNGVPSAVSKRVVLQVEFPPVVHVGNQLVGATRDSEVLLDCYIEAHPRAVNYWMFGGNMLLRGKRYEIEEAPLGFKSHLRLIIKRVREEDFGQYTCVSENSLGYDDASINVLDNRFIVKNTMEATLVIYNEKHSQGLLPNVSYPSASDYATCVSNKTVGTLLVCLLFIAVL